MPHLPTAMVGRRTGAEAGGAVSAYLFPARLTRRGDRLMCGRGRVCDGRIAEVADRRVPGIPGIRTLPGWYPGADGRWRLSVRARRRVQEGAAPRLRRSVAARAVPAGQALEGGRVMEDAPPRDWIEQPTEFICPLCSARNLVDPTVLAP